MVWLRRTSNQCNHVRLHGTTGTRNDETTKLHLCSKQEVYSNRTIPWCTEYLRVSQTCAIIDARSSMKAEMNYSSTEDWHQTCYLGNKGLESTHSTAVSCPTVHLSILAEETINLSGPHHVGPCWEYCSNNFSFSSIISRILHFKTCSVSTFSYQRAHASHNTRRLTHQVYLVRKAPTMEAHSSHPLHEKTAQLNWQLR